MPSLKTVHFICKANVFRSRLAEAYFNSQNLLGFSATSSGVKAKRNSEGVVSYYTQRILKKNNLLEYDKGHWDQTTPELVGQAYKTVFVLPKYYHYYLRELGGQEFEPIIWQIPDLGDVLPDFELSQADYQQEAEALRRTDEIFELIKREVDQLVQDLELT